MRSGHELFEVITVLDWNEK